MRAITLRVLILAGALVALAAPPVQATLTYVGSFGGPGTGAGQFSSGTGPNGVAVNYTTGDVYVSDRNNNRVEQFDSTGVFIRAWGKGVNQTSGGDVCPRPGNPGDVCQAGTSSGGKGGFAHPQGIGVDNSTGPAEGSVYVQDAGNSRIQEFTADGAFVLMWGKEVNQTTGGDICPRPGIPGDVCVAGGTSGFESQTVTPTSPSVPGEFAGWGQVIHDEEPNLAVDGNGYVYVGDRNASPHSRIQKFDSTGAFVSQVGPSQVGGGFADQPSGPQNGGESTIAADPSGNIFALDVPVGGILRFPPSSFTASGLENGHDRIYGAENDVGGGGGRPQAFAIDPTNDFLLVGATNSTGCGAGPIGFHIREFHPSGQQVDCTPTASTGLNDNGSGGMAISPAHRLYVADPSAGLIRIFTTPVATPPTVGTQTATEITSGKAVLKTQIAANLDDTTTYHLEYGTSPCSTIVCTSTPESSSIGASFTPRPVNTNITNLTPDTTYYYRFVATNGEGTVPGPDRHFTTFAPNPPFDPSCTNNLARQQTGAAFLLDCRAYELVSAENTGGYNVESDLIPGQTPFGGYPGADGQALYAVHNGGIPGTGKPTNRGPDPYVATRDAANQRWDTTYVGIPADAPSLAPFSSTLAGADAGLDSFAFGAASGFCSPCFADGSVGIPLRLPDGSLVQGMAGSVPVSLPVSAGTVRKPFSDNGRYFVFGSKQAFEPTANDNSTDATIYERDLEGGTTEVLSTDGSGNPIQNGVGIAELDVSTDGSRVLIGERLGTDAAGNPLYRLYLHIAGAAGSYQLTPGAPSGVLYAGMSADGTKVFFTTKDKVTSDDHDSSADLYETDVDPYGAVSIHRVSTGESGTGDTNNCNPTGDSASYHWNAPAGAAADCSALAIGGGGGVALGDGTVYFLSPETLDTSGATQPVQDEPNLYLARPGSDPKFVATLESESNGPQPPVNVYTYKQSFGSFTKAGGVAVDHASGDVYVLDLGKPAIGLNPAVPATVRKFDAAGNPANFSCPSCSAAGTNSLSGADAPSGAFSPLVQGIARTSPNQIAVDQPTGKLYVPDYGHNVVDAFNSDGSYASQLAVNTPSAVTIAPNGDVYVTNKGASQVTIFPAGGGPSSSFSVSANAAGPTGVAVDSAGQVYVVNNSKAVLYNAAHSFVKVLDANASFGVAVNPTNDDVVVDEAPTVDEHGNPIDPANRSRLVEFDSSGNPIGGGDGAGAPVGVGKLTSATGIGLDALGSAYVSNNGTSVALFHRSLKPDRRIDSPLVLHSLSDAGTRHTADFQTNPSGDQAVLASTLPLGGFDSDGYYEIFRYDADAGGDPVCISCNPTDTPPTSDASLASNGSSLTDDGRVFFNSAEPLVLRDANSKQDAYEWENGKVELISSGQSGLDSGLLSVTHDGTDALFFTREVLASNDQNGTLMKLYDARAGGGFFTIPPPPACAASDECHGPSSATPPPPNIATNTGNDGGNCDATVSSCGSAPKCKKGTVKRHGRCVARHPKKGRGHTRHTRHHKRGQGR